MSVTDAKSVGGDFVKVSIHGHVYRVPTSRLATDHPGSRLSKLTETDQEYDVDSGCYFFNKSTEVFNCVVDYVETGRKTHFPKW